MPGVLVILLTAMVAAIMYRLMGPTPIAAENKDIVVYMAGSINTAWLGACGYYYQTTYGSKAKDKLLADSMPNTRQSEEHQ